MEEEYEEGYETNETDAFSNVAQGLSGENKAALVGYWQQAIDNIERIGEDGSAVSAFKSTALPLARIKKVMKTDSEVCMISAEAPILFAKGCDIFITELTMRAWIHAEESKRRTLQRSDIANALQKSDMFDFLIDIVPREEAHTRRYAAATPGSAMTTGDMPVEMGGPGPSSAADEVQAHLASASTAPQALARGMHSPHRAPPTGAAPPQVATHRGPAPDGRAGLEGQSGAAVGEDPQGESSDGDDLESLDGQPPSNVKMEGGPNFEEGFQYPYNDGNPVYSTVDVGFRGF